MNKQINVESEHKIPVGLNLMIPAVILTDMHQLATSSLGSLTSWKLKDCNCGGSKSMYVQIVEFNPSGNFFLLLARMFPE